MGKCTICGKVVSPDKDQMIVKDGYDYFMFCLDHENSTELEKWIGKRIREYGSDDEQTNTTR